MVLEKEKSHLLLATIAIAFGVLGQNQREELWHGRSRELLGWRGCQAGEAGWKASLAEHLREEEEIMRVEIIEGGSQTKPM